MSGPDVGGLPTLASTHQTIGTLARSSSSLRYGVPPRHVGPSDPLGACPEHGQVPWYPAPVMAR